MLLGVSDLLAAIENGDKEKAKELILRGCDINQKARLTGATPLYAACIRNYQDIAELLISKGADVNAPLSVGTTALHYMAKYSDERGLDMVGFLLTRGAKVETEDRDGISPLHSACENKDSAIAELLIRGGADIHKRTRQGATPLHFAVNAGHTFLVGLLLEKGANVNDAQNAEGVTPLHVAAANGHAEITKLLLSRHADASAKDKSGRTPAQLAEDVFDPEHEAVRSILRQDGQT
jgi:ankyrin repeat protein